LEGLNKGGRVDQNIQQPWGKFRTAYSTFFGITIWRKSFEKLCSDENKILKCGGVFTGCI
jgi:hypothetical protein